MKTDLIENKQEEGIEEIGKKKKKEYKCKLTETEIAIYKFYTSRNQIPVFIVKDGVKIEVQHDQELGFQNSVHFVLRHPQQTLFNFLVNDLKTPVDESDYQGRTPFLIHALHKPSQTPDEEIVKYLLEANVRVELTDTRGRTPFLIFYEH